MGRRFAVPLAGASIMVTAATGGFGLMTQLLLKSQNAPIPLITVAASLGSAGALLGSSLWGRISDRASRRLLLLITIVGVALAIGLLVPLPPASIVVTSSFLRSLMDAGFAAVSLAMVSAASAAARRGKNLSYVSSSRSLGFAIGSMCGGLILEVFGFRGGFALMATMPMVGLLFLLFLPHDRAPKVERAETPWKTLRAAGLTDLYLATMLRQMGMNGAFSLLYVYMDILGIAPGLMGVISAGNTASQVLLLLVFGRIVDRVGRSRVFLLGFALSALAIVAFALATGPLGMVVGYLMVGASFSSLYIGSTAHIGDRVPQERQGTMLGLYETMRGLGGVIGPLICGVIATWFGYQMMFFAMAGVATLGFSVLVVGRQVRRKRQT